jgi:signal transduction histidine kinase/ActR/RegA family two-component response regulator
MRKNGSIIEAAVTISPVRDQEGRIISASAITRDITEEKRAQQQRADLLERERLARTEAETANRLKDEFLATVSHELRTPLTAILGWTKLLQSKGLDEQTEKRALQAMERNAKAQASLIEEILDVSRIITGKLRLDVRPLELPAILSSAIDAVAPAAQAKSIQLEKEIDPAAGRVLGDAQRLQQIVWNLLSNAIKFTPRSGSVTVGLARMNSYVEITVQDSGSGISPDFLPHVFERFRQADSSTSRSHGGLGLGLAIVRHLTELHGGSVHADSPGEGAGATFSVRLPLIPASDIQSIDLSSGPQKPSDGIIEFRPATALKNIKILVVEDEADARAMLASVLRQSGAEVLIAASGKEAFEAMPTFKPNILVSDIGMPGEDGYGFIRRVRSFESQAGLTAIPAVALTAYARADDRSKAMEAGFQIHLGKPIDPTELVGAIARLNRMEAAVRKS